MGSSGLLEVPCCQSGGCVKKKYKRLTPDERKKVYDMVKVMLHASRDCMRNQGRDTTKQTWNVNDGYYGEAFGILRGLELLGYGYLGDCIRPDPNIKIWNLKWWFRQLEDEVLKEEHFDGNNQCDFCLTRYGKDGAGRERGLIDVPKETRIPTQSS